MVLCACQWMPLTLTKTSLSFIDPRGQNKDVAVLETSKTHICCGDLIRDGKPVTQMSFKLLCGSYGESLRLLFEV